MFDVLMYLFETYIHSDADVMVEQDELTDELSRAGFDKDEIEKALNWLERLANLHDSEREVYVTASQQGSADLRRRSWFASVLNVAVSCCSWSRRKC
jgi:Smg protein